MGAGKVGQHVFFFDDDDDGAAVRGRYEAFEGRCVPRGDAHAQLDRVHVDPLALRSLTDLDRGK